MEEVAALRSALGDEFVLTADLHGKLTPRQAVELAKELARFALAFIEASTAPKDAEGLAYVARHSPVPVARGEEWATEFEAQRRIARKAISFIQPEMAHTGVSQFVRIAKLAQVAGVSVVPPATIGVDFFLAASVQVSATLDNRWRHEYQPPVFDPNLSLSTTDFARLPYGYVLPSGAGLGVEPNDRFWRHATLVA